MATPSPLVPFLEINLLEAKDLPAVNKMSSGSDPYVIMYLASKPKDRHKSKIFKNEVNPKWNETFIIKLTDSDLLQGRFNDNLILEVYNFSTIGKPKTIGDISVRLNLTEGDQSENWEQVKVEKGKGPNAQIRLGLSLQKAPLEDIPIPIKSHTGNSVESFYNSVTRTVAKKARKGDRSGAATVAWIDVTVVEGKGFTPIGDKRVANPYFFVLLNSSDKKKRKSKVVRGAEAPRWNQTFGFEVTSIVRDKMEDGLKIICRDYNPIGSAGDFGQAYVPLNTLEEGGTQDLWVPVGQSKAQLHLILKRTQKKVEDLESDLLLDKLNARLMYFLNLVRLRMGDLGIELKLHIEVAIASFTIGASVSLHGKEDEKAIAEEQENLEQDLTPIDEVTTIDGNTVPQNGNGNNLEQEKGFAVGKVEKLCKSIGRAINKWTSNGIKGELSLGFSFNMFQSGFTITVSVAIA